MIVPELCKGCSKCARVCPVQAITGEIKKTYIIDQEKCIKCGACYEACPFNAITVGQEKIMTTQYMEINNKKVEITGKEKNILEVARGMEIGRAHV